MVRPPQLDSFRMSASLCSLTGEVTRQIPRPDKRRKINATSKVQKKPIFEVSRDKNQQEAIGMEKYTGEYEKGRNDDEDHQAATGSGSHRNFLEKSFVSIFEWVFRLKSGSEALPTAPSEPTSPNQPNTSFQKPKENGIPGYEFEENETTHSGKFLKEENKEGGDKTITVNNSAEAKGKSALKGGLSEEQRKKLFEKRNQADLHEIIVPERIEKIEKKDDESFLENISFYHGFLPQMETMIFIKRSGDFLLRKCEDEGKEFLVISVGILLDCVEDDAENLDEDYGKNEAVRIEDYIVRRHEIGVFIEQHMVFECLEDLFVFYMLHPNKASLNVHLKRACPRRVFLAEVNSFGIYGEVVAVKSLLKDSANLSNLKEKLLAEARIMLSLRHENVVEICGWAIDKQPFMVLIEYMESGSLDSFLIQNFEGSNKSLLLKFAFEAAKGLHYLHEMLVLHRDMAARNCLLSSDLTLKIGDFGLAVNGRFHYMKTAEKLPTRYLSPETLSMFVFFQATDCFALGNLIFEIFSGGMMPYEEFSSADARLKIVNSELNDLGTTRAPPALRSFVEEKLWTYQMKDRAGMEEIVHFLKGLYKEYKKRSMEGEPKTSTQASEEVTLGNQEVEAVKKGMSKKMRRRKPVRRADLLEDICPTQEETAANID
ncbi:unnamed protein product [Caenorhabditis auriculariae]|uniref:Tyrosine-protein kinase n=1 Tax=Caenorhabditis auriculariae TaxID=2777116 RepID=A0A8S1GQB0_9PELO|nr:unnamed protein product [Caenorhabditis auriculariae]